MHTLEPGTRLNLFADHSADRWLDQCLFLGFLGSATLITIGFLTRFNSVLVYLCLASMQQRNLSILHGGDTFLQCPDSSLIFAPAGAALSVDRLIRVWRGKEGAEIRPRSPWGNG